MKFAKVLVLICVAEVDAAVGGDGRCSDGSTMMAVARKKNDLVMMGVRCRARGAEAYEH